MDYLQGYTKDSNQVFIELIYIYIYIYVIEQLRNNNENMLKKLKISYDIMRKYEKLNREREHHESTWFNFKCLHKGCEAWTRPGGLIRLTMNQVQKKDACAY